MCEYECISYTWPLRCRSFHRRVHPSKPRIVTICPIMLSMLQDRYPSEHFSSLISSRKADLQPGDCAADTVECIRVPFPRCRCRKKIVHGEVEAFDPYECLGEEDEGSTVGNELLSLEDVFLKERYGEKEWLEEIAHKTGSGYVSSLVDETKEKESDQRSENGEVELGKRKWR